MFEFEIVIDLLHAGADPNLMYRYLLKLSSLLINVYILMI